MAAVKRFRAKLMYLIPNSFILTAVGRPICLKRLQTAAMVVMVIFYPDKFLYEFYWEKDIRAILVFSISSKVILSAQAAQMTQSGSSIFGSGFLTFVWGL